MLNEGLQNFLAPFNISESALVCPYSNSLQSVLVNIITCNQNDARSHITAKQSGMTIKKNENSNLEVSMGSLSLKSEPRDQVLARKRRKLEAEIAKINKYKHINGDIINKVGDLSQELKDSAVKLAEFILKSDASGVISEDNLSLMSRTLNEELKEPLAKYCEIANLKINIQKNNPVVEESKSIVGLGGFKIKLQPNDDPELYNIKKAIKAQELLYQIYIKKFVNQEVKVLNKTGNELIERQRFSVDNLGRPHGYGIFESSILKYTGELKEGRFSGEGEIIAFEQNQVYKGTFENGFLVNGTITSPDRKLSGEFQNLKLIKGKFETSGCTFEGDFNGENFNGTCTAGHRRAVGSFKNFHPEGYCTFYEGQKIIFQGLCHNGLAEGQGIVYKDNGITISGNFHEDKLHGNGKIVNEKEGISIEGTFVNDKFVSGTRIQSNEKLVGQFLNGQLHGKGQIFRNNSLINEGTFEYGKLNGYGKIYDGQWRYEGNLKDSLMHGIGKLWVNNETWYEGNFICGKLPNGKWIGGSRRYEGAFLNFQSSGFGKLYENNSLVYEGNFADDNLSGQGKMYTGNQRLEGIFQNGSFISGKCFIDGQLYYDGQIGSNKQPNGYGKIYQNGSIYYDGQICNGTPHGSGTAYINSRVYAGNFNMGTLLNQKII